MLAQYKKSLRGSIEMMRKLKEREQELICQPDSIEIRAELERIGIDKRLVNGMIENMRDLISWIETGVNPYYQQGFDTRNSYDITFKNMELIPDIYEEIRGERKEFTLNDERKEILRQMFKVFTKREADCVVLHIANKYTMAETGEMLGIKKTTVQNHVEKAKKKIEKIMDGTGMVQNSI